MKQGKIAKVQSKKQSHMVLKNQLKSKPQSLKSEQALDFILVRYHLTSHVNDLVEETNRRFIQELMGLGHQLQMPWSLFKLVQLGIQQIDVGVPWQFYKVLYESWHETKHFLIKEIPAIPIDPQIRIKDDLSQQQFQELVVDKLASNWFINQFTANPDQLAKVTGKQIQALADSFKMNHDINWQKVAQLNESVRLHPIEQIDEGTSKWLLQLQEENEKDVNETSSFH